MAKNLPEEKGFGHSTPSAEGGEREERRGSQHEVVRERVHGEERRGIACEKLVRFLLPSGRLDSEEKKGRRVQATKVGSKAEAPKKL